MPPLHNRCSFGDQSLHWPHKTCIKPARFMSRFIIGQRWISESEPELGLGTVDHADSNRVQIAFKAAGVTRTYSADLAPLKRVRFRVGDKIKTQTGNEF